MYILKQDVEGKNVTTVLLFPHPQVSIPPHDGSAALLNIWLFNLSSLSANIIDWHKLYKSTNRRDLNAIIDGRTSELIIQSWRKPQISQMESPSDWCREISALSSVSMSTVPIYVTVLTFWTIVATSASLDPSIHLHRFCCIIGSLCRAQEALGDKERGQRDRLHDPSDST